MSYEDKFETLEKIGHGSFGIIRKVRRKNDGFVMCRKEISYTRMSQKERQQLHSEFQILSTLRHPNIVAYHHREHLKLSQDLHLYMEYCGNGDLGRVIKDLDVKREWAEEGFVWSIFTQLLMALYRCHYGIDPPEVGTDILGLTQGDAKPGLEVAPGAVTILHRDLKPENVFLGEDNSVKLGDFGLSKMMASQDFASTYVGTPFYMSPEICNAEKYTLKSDIWSLGCIIYELCSKQPPFNATSHFQLINKIKEGKTAPLPDIYSPDLKAVIKDCLKVNPDRRPDTAKLLNLPFVKLMRKEKEVVDLNNRVRAREDAVRRKEREINERVGGLDRERLSIRDELESCLRREWEVKARLEIDRHINTEITNLHNKFEDEVRLRVESELQRATAAPSHEPRHIDDFSSSASGHHGAHHSSVGADSEDFPSTTDLTDYSIESPETVKEPKKTARTPFGRAQTMFAGNAGTPMDIEMASPSPIAIASLSLSPRRTGATKAPSSHTANIFAAANGGARWDAPGEPTLMESDDEEDMVPSPTRQIRSSRNPFTSKTRPVLTSQRTAPMPIPRLKSQTSTIGGGLVSKATIGLPGPTSDQSGRTSPIRRLTKIPSAANLQAESAATASPSAGAPRGFPHVKGDSSSSSSSNETLAKTAQKNNIKGRTLVELQQARAGGRPLSAAPALTASGENPSYPPTSPKRPISARMGMGIRRSSGEEPAAVWDPERDEMPSPFLRRRREARV